jgi:hypothetical protein
MTDKRRKTTIRRLPQPNTPEGIRAYRSTHRNIPLMPEERSRMLVRSLAIDALDIDHSKKGSLCMVVNAGLPDEVVFGTADLKGGGFARAIHHEARRALNQVKYVPEAAEPRCRFCGIGTELSREELVREARAIIAEQERQESKTRKMIDAAVKRKRARDGKKDT